jgi:hypothetical protein
MHGGGGAAVGLVHEQQHQYICATCTGVARMLITTSLLLYFHCWLPAYLEYLYAGRLRFL